jgi:hypothetical protein
LLLKYLFCQDILVLFALKPPHFPEFLSVSVPDRDHPI